MDIAVIIRERGASGTASGRTTACEKYSIRHIRSKWADFEIQWTPETPPGMSCGWAPLRDGWVCWLAEKTTLLGLRRAISASSAMNDTEIMRESIERWGFDAVHKTHSVWAGAIWQESAAKLCFFRDRVGMVPTFYFSERSANSPIQIFSTSVALIQTHCPSAREVNFDRLRRFLLIDDTPQRDDFFKGIRRLHPGEAWQLNRFANEPQVRRYWQPQPPSGFARNLSKPADAFLLNRLKEVVRGYGEAGYAPLTSVSGGLDSTILLALQVEYAREMGADAPDVAAATMGFPSFPSVDESHWTGQLQNHLDHPIKSIFLEDHWPMRDPSVYINQSALGPEFHPGAGYESVFIQRANQIFGERSVFNGIGADQLFIINDHRMLDSLLTDLNLPWNGRLVEAERRVGKNRLTRYLFGKTPVAPVLRKFRNRYQNLRDSLRTPEFSWHEPKRWVRVDYLPDDSAIKSETDPGDHSFLSGWGWELVIRGLWRKNQHLGVSHHLPYLRADFMRDLFTIEPHHVNLGRSYQKGLLRQMGQGYLPESIQKRIKGGLFSKFVESGLSVRERHNIEKMFRADSALAGYGLIEPYKFLNIFLEYCRFCSPNNPMASPAGEMRFWRTISAELWLRKMN